MHADLAAPSAFLAGRSVRARHALAAGARALIATSVALLALSTAAPPATAQPLDEAAAFEGALLEYERNHWPQAWQALSALADRGHPEAARIALQMWAHGPRLYGTTFAPTPVQLSLWTRRVACTADASPLCRQATALR